MRTARKVVGALSTLLLIAPATARAACDFVGAPADGRVNGPYSLSSATNDISVAWIPEAGRSYVVEAANNRGPAGGGSSTITIDLNSSFCPTTDTAAGGTTLRDISGVTSAVGILGG